MTNDELNKYIQHYIEKDKTGRAIMLTGPWGIGKSYYIRNGLIPFLSKPENGKHSCIVVSLYGLSSLAEVSKAIYFEARMKKLSFKSEAGKAAVLTGKTVLKGVASFFGVDLSVDANSLQELYESIDLSGKLIILEDVERTEIDVLQILGYVNNLVEQDGVKVLLVTNEDEIVQFEPIKEENAEKEEAALFIDKVTEHKNRKYTQETIRYLEIKEKTVGDTIIFTGDLKAAINQIIRSFENGFLSKYENDNCAEDIIAIMAQMDSSNLRSFIFACQKTVDIYERIIGAGPYSEDFLKSIFYGILFFSLRLHAGTKTEWDGMQYFSSELGNSKYPLFRFCYDYITAQRMDFSTLTQSVEAFDHFRLYDPSKTDSDQDLQVLNGYYLHYEQEILTAVKNITSRLSNPDDISFYDYGRLAVALIVVKYNLGIDIEDAKKLLINNLRGRCHDLNADHIFWYSIDENGEARDEFLELRKEMIAALNENGAVIPGFDYLPEQSKLLFDYTRNNTGFIFEMHGFAKYLDVTRFVTMLINCSPEQMDTLRRAFSSLYSPGNIREFLPDELPAIELLISNIEAKQEYFKNDGVRLLQYKWIIDKLVAIRKKYL